MRAAASSLSLLLLAACAETPDDDAPADDSDPAIEDSDPVDSDPGETDLTPDGCADDDVDALPLAPEGPFIERGGPTEGAVPGCAAAWHAFAGAKQSVLDVRLDTWDGPGPARLTVFDLQGHPLSAGRSLHAGDTVRVTLPRSGETLLRVTPEAPTPDEVAYEVSIACVDGCDLAWTRYPIVLMHGPVAGGRGSPVDNWRSAIESMQAAGYAVFSPTAELLNSPSARGPSWRRALNDLEDQGYGRRFNLIGHSQGGLDARWLVGKGGEAHRVASVTTVSTPHLGNPLADVALGLLQLSGGVEDAAEIITEVFGVLLGQSGQDLADTLASMTVDEMTTFNADVPDQPNVAYFSWSAKACSAIDLLCRQNIKVDVVPTLLEPTQAALKILRGENDGVVPTSSAVWGRHLGAVFADHMEQIGDVPQNPSPSFDQAAFFLGEAERLAAAGF